MAAKTETRAIRFPPELLAALLCSAGDNHRSLQNEIIFRLSTTINNEMVPITGSAAVSLDEVLRKTGLDRTTIVSAALNHYRTMVERILMEPVAIPTNDDKP